MTVITSMSREDGNFISRQNMCVFPKKFKRGFSFIGIVPSLKILWMSRQNKELENIGKAVLDRCQQMYDCLK